MFLWLLGKEVEPDSMKFLKYWGYNFYLDTPGINTMSASPHAHVMEKYQNGNIWPELVIENCISFPQL